MALVSCHECKKEISSEARACPSCGAKVPRFKWWLWVPLSLFGVVLLFGLLTPQYKIEARELRQACEKMIASEPNRQRECDLIYIEAINRGKARQ